MEEQAKPKKPRSKAAAAAAPSIQPPPAPKAPPLPEPKTYALDDSAFEGAVANQKSARVRPTTAHDSSGWIQGPGAVMLLAEAGYNLNEVSALRHLPTARVTHVRTLALPAVKTLLVWPADDEDAEKIPVTWKDGQVHFNASDVLIRAKIAVESGRRKKFEVHVLKDSKVGPALAIDMRYVLDVKVLPKNSKSSTGGEDDPDESSDLDLDEE